MMGEEQEEQDVEIGEGWKVSIMGVKLGDLEGQRSCQRGGIQDCGLA